MIKFLPDFVPDYLIFLLEFVRCITKNRPFALRGHVTNAPLKKWVVNNLADAKNWKNILNLSYTQNLSGNAVKGDNL